MSRLALLAAGALVLAVVTGCGPAGALGPAPADGSPVSPSGSVVPSLAPAEPSDQTDPAATDPAATDPAATDPAATDPATTDPPVTPPANPAPAGLAPAFPGLPAPSPPTIAEIPVDGPPLDATGTVDLAVACVSLIDLELGPAEGIDSMGDSVHGGIPCGSSGPIIMRFGVPVEVAHLYRVHETDVVSPPALRVASGDRFSPEGAARLAAAVGVTTVTVSVSCDAGSDVTLAGETLPCRSPYQPVRFSQPVAATTALTDLRLPAGASALVYLAPAP